MYPRNFEYYRAKSVDDALDALRSKEGSKVIAGGQSLVPLMKLRFASPSCLVDISGLDDLKHIREEADQETGAGHVLRIGALVTHAELIESELVERRAPLLRSTAMNIGDEQIRSLGTIGGSLCHADPSADYFPTLLVLDAHLVVKSREGRRVLPVGEFTNGPFATEVGEGELLEEVVVPVGKQGASAVKKFARRKADFAIVGLAAFLQVSAAGGGGRIDDVRIAVGPQEDHATRLTRVEDALRSRAFAGVRPLVEAAVGGLRQEELHFPTDVHGSSAYRNEVLASMLSDMLSRLYEFQVVPRPEGAAPRGG